MFSQTKAIPSTHNRSTSTAQDIPMSIFNPQLLDEAQRASAIKDRLSTNTSQQLRSSGSRHSRRGHQKRVVSVSVTASAGVGCEKDSDEEAMKGRRSIGTRQSTPSKRHPSHDYTRPMGPELVSINQPSCTGLPQTWTTVHDRFIAYLATHAPLDKTGKVQRKEESRERWRNEDITRLVMERFAELNGCIKVCMIENRLVLLDQAGDNDYFKMPYGAYKFEKWGRGV